MRPDGPGAQPPLRQWEKGTNRNGVARARKKQEAVALSALAFQQRWIRNADDDPGTQA